MRAGRHDAAISAYRKILRKDPSDIRAKYRIAVVMLIAGRFADGEKLLRECLEAQPENADILFSLGRACHAQGRHDHAIEALTRAAAIAPRRSDIKSALGDAYFLSDKLEQAFGIYREAIALKPDDVRTRINFAQILSRSGKRPEAVELMRTAYAGASNQPGVAKIFAQALSANGDTEEALTVIDKVIGENPNDIGAIASKATTLDRAGENRAAGELLLPHLESSTKSTQFAHACGQVALNQSDDVLPLDRAASLIETCVGEDIANSFERRSLLFTLSGLLDKLGNYAQAFEYCQAANAVLPSTYDPAEVDERFDNYRKIFETGNLPSLARASTRSERPLFILGMPRSGTTLVEQILDSHPQVSGGGELPDIQFASRDIAGYPASLQDISTTLLDAVAAAFLETLGDISADTRYVTDKMPINFEHLGFIWQMFPDARIIHCRRHPLDISLSCLFQNFQNGNSFAWDMSSLAHYFRHYDEIMSFWGRTLDLPRFDLRYDDLIADPQKTVAALLEFCDLPWDDACLAFDKNKRFIKTASYAQVRRPINKAGLGRHLKYADQLAPLADALADEIARYEAGN